jgi:hypothetical protein
MEILQLVVVAELDIVRVTGFKSEADAPLIVDEDGILTRAIASERVQAIAWRNLEVGDLVRDVHGFELAQSTSGNVGGHLPGLAGAEELFSVPVGERLDHIDNCNASRDARQ